MLAPMPSMELESETSRFGNPDSDKKQHALSANGCGGGAAKLRRRSERRIGTSIRDGSAVLLSPPAIECWEEAPETLSQTFNAAVSVVGIDIGKNSFHIVGHDERGAIVLRQMWSRGQVEARFANMPLHAWSASAVREFNAASPHPPGLTQTFDKMSVVFWSKPRSSLADIHVECPRCA